MMIEYVLSREMKLGRGDLMALGHIVIRNWMILSMFAIGQEAVGAVTKEPEYEKDIPKTGS